MDMDYLASLLDEIYQLIHSYFGSWGIIDDGFSIFDDPNADLYTIYDSGVMHAIYTYHGGDDDC